MNPNTIDSAPLFQLLTSIVMEGPGMLIRGAGRALSGAMEGLSQAGSNLGGGGEGFSLSGMLGLGGDKGGPEIAPARAPEQSISAPAQAICKYDVPMSDLGSFSPPSVGSAARSNDIGMVA